MRRAPERPRPKRSRRIGSDPHRFRQLVYAVVRRIPRGRVATYSEVAEATGHPRAARAVGRALAKLSPPLARVVPWHRVVNARGGISRRDPEAMALQRELLEVEGVRLRAGRVDLASMRRPNLPRILARTRHRAPIQIASTSGPSRARRARWGTRSALIPS
jgi:methylated-DNA-protein-cysteine methyltransferase-like protein